MLKSAHELICSIEEGLAPFHFLLKPAENQGLSTHSQRQFLHTLLPVLYCYADKRAGTVLQFIHQETTVSSLLWFEFVKFYQADLAKASKGLGMVFWPLRRREQSPEMNTVLLDQRAYLAGAQLWTLRRLFPLTRHG